MTRMKHVGAITRKVLQAAAIWLPLLLVIAAVRLSVLRLPQLWMLTGVSILVNVLQPSYRPFEGSRTVEDRGTAVQILWTVYITQAAAVFELALRRRAALPVGLMTWVAFGAMAAGLGLRTWAVALLGPWFTWNLTVQARQQLVVSGPYGLIRHPGYSGALLTFVASCVLLRSWVVAVLATIALTLAFLRRIRYEEALLAQSLTGYNEYRLRTGKLIPRFFRASPL